MNNKIFIFLQKNYGWIVALFTGISICLSFVLRLLKYIYAKLYFNYYGISFGLFNMEELDVLYSFCISILLILCFYSLMYCFKEIYDAIRNKNFSKKILIDVFLIIISNIVISFSFNVKISFFQALIFNILLVFTEILSLFLFIKINKREKFSEFFYEDYLSYLKVFPFYFLLLIILFSASYLSSIISNKSYNVIDDSKVIVYTTSDYYVVVDANLKDDELIIYRGHQTKISNENVSSKLMEFEDVKVLEQ